MGRNQVKRDRERPSSVWYYGRTTLTPKAIPLRAGPLEMRFEPETAFLRYIRLGNREVLRGIYAAVRDSDWGTAAPHVHDLHCVLTPESFRLTFVADCRQAGLSFSWRGKVEGRANGTVRYTFDGTARSTFRANRVGFCVLHPVRECQGRPCRLLKTNGDIEQSIFPCRIAPHQPFVNLCGITHDVLPGLAAEVRFAGDTFETEDQRNWTDASYKTYCTPLARPYPVTVHKGARVRQAVTLNLKGRRPASCAAAAPDCGVTFQLSGEPAIPLPAIGVEVARHGQALSKTEAARLRALRLAHLRVSLVLAAQEWPQEFQMAVAQARALGVPLEVALFLSAFVEEELAQLRAALERSRLNVTRWLVFDSEKHATTAHSVQLARSHLTRINPQTMIGAGTNKYFAELNRNRPAVKALDFVAYSLCPQVHAFDNATLVENLEAQGWTVRNAQVFAGGKPIVISPVTLRRRPSGVEPSEADCRQMSLFGAGWTLGSFKHLAEQGAASITYYETTGCRGVMKAARGTPLPHRFPSLPGVVFPLYHVLADIGEFAGGRIVPSISSRPLEIEGIALRAGTRMRVMLANLSARPQLVRVRCASLGAWVSMKVLDETNVSEAQRAPEAYRQEPSPLAQTVHGQLDVGLRPFAVMRIDAARKGEAQ